VEVFREPYKQHLCSRPVRQPRSWVRMYRSRELCIASRDAESVAYANRTYCTLYSNISNPRRKHKAAFHLVHPTLLVLSVCTGRRPFSVGRAACVNLDDVSGLAQGNETRARLLILLSTGSLYAPLRRSSPIRCSRFLARKHRSQKSGGWGALDQVVIFSMGPLHNRDDFFLV
jgi:hypothetical protein